MAARPTQPASSPNEKHAATALPQLTSSFSLPQLHTGDKLGSSTCLQLELKNIQSSVNNMMNRIPYPLRESVQATLNVLTQKTEELQYHLDSKSLEFSNLQKELKAEVSRGQGLEKVNAKYRECLRQHEDRVNTLQDDLDTRQNHIATNTNFINRLSSTNHLMIDSFNTLKSSTPDNKSNSDMKSILLRIVRDNYQCKKTINDHEERILEYRETVRRLDRQNRVYQRQLEDMKSSLSSDALEALHANGGGVDESAGRKQNLREKSTYAKFDALLMKSLVEPISFILKIKDLMRQISLCKLSGSLDEVVSYFCTDDFTRLLGVDAVVIFVKSLHSPSIYKFSSHSRKAETLHKLHSMSLMHNMFNANTHRSGCIDKLFNEDTDGCVGLPMHHYLSFPLLSEDAEPNLGVMHFLNRSDGQAFMELDEVLCGLCAENITSRIASLLSFDLLAKKCTLLQDIDEVHSLFFATLSVPKAVTPAVLTALDVINAAELVVKRALNTQKCRVFLKSNLLDPNIVDHLAFVKQVNIEAVPSKSGIEYGLISAGVAGRVVTTALEYAVKSPSSDSYFNPTVDIDPSDMALVCVPLISLEDKVLGCVQVVMDQLMLAAHNSSEQDVNEGLTQNAIVKRLARNLVGPLNHALGFLDKQFVPPSFNR